MAETANDLVIRPVADSDSAALIALIETVFGEYPNCYLDIDNEMPELRAPARAAREDESRWWVAESDGAVVGSCAVFQDEDDTVELKRLYVAKEARRQGLAAHLVSLVEAEAKNRAAKRVVLWSDTRFADAHRLYERLGFAKQPRTRALPDISNTIEFQYIKELTP